MYGSSTRQVLGHGPLDAHIVCIGEAPGQNEDRTGRPFQGPAGMLLDKWLREEARVDRRAVYVDNVHQYRPAGNKIEAVPPAVLADSVDDLLNVRLKRLRDPVVIVPMGNVALKALTGFSSVTKHRGSIYEWNGVKVIPTVHPAATFRDPTLEAACRADWRRIGSDSKFRELRLPERDYYIAPTMDDLRWFEAELAACEAPILSIDIETPRRTEWLPTVLKSGKPGKPKRMLGDAYIGCVGFSFDPRFAICVPTTVEYWGSKQRTAEAWAWVKRLCESAYEKVLQNGFFDCWWLMREQGVRVRNYRYDLKAMHHCLDSTGEHSLAYMASVDTREPYWKDDTKGEDLSGLPQDIRTYWAYNCKDSAVQRELCDVYVNRLHQAKLWEFYIQHYRNLFAPLLDMMLSGVTVDNAARLAMQLEVVGRIDATRDELNALTGTTLYGKKDLSPKKLAEFLYGTLKLPKQRDRKTGGLTTKEVVVRKLMQRYQQNSVLSQSGSLILAQRRQQQLLKFVSDSRVASDGRFRTSYSFTPETRRLSSTKAPDRTGSNQQNQDRDVRSMFVPDDGHCFLKVDLSQVESRIVMVLTKDKFLCEKAKLPPDQLDEHREIAARIFHCDEAAVTKDQRYVGKRANHAGNYGMGGLRLSEELLKDGYVFTAEECDQYLAAVRSMKPAVTDWQREIRKRVLNDRKLTNSWGGTICYRYERLGDELYRRAYAYLPQSEVPGLMGQWGLLPLWLALRRGSYPGARIAAYVHDELLVSTPPEHAYGIAELLDASLSRERSYEGVPLGVPCEFTIGASWKGDVDWKRLPSEAAMKDAAYAYCNDKLQVRSVRQRTVGDSGRRVTSSGVALRVVGAGG